MEVLFPTLHLEMISIFDVELCLLDVEKEWISLVSFVVTILRVESRVLCILAKCFTVEPCL